MKKFAFACVAVLAVSAAQANTVFSNSAAPGDFINTGNVGGTGFQELGSSNWFYRDLSGSGEVGANTTFARSGNGSMEFTSTGPADQASVALYADGNTNFGGLVGNHGTLSQLSSLAYDHYRVSGSTSGGNAVVKLELQNTGLSSGGYGQLVFDFASSGLTPTGDAWDQIDIFGNRTSYKFRGTSGLGAFTGGNNFQFETLDWWMGQVGDWDIVTVNFGIGSGENGTFNGAVDNLKMTVGNNDLSTNFEAVPEPFTMASLGLAWLAARRKKKKAA